MDLAKNMFMFDTLAFTKKLKGAGVPEKQAEAQAEAIAEVVNDQIATKFDINNLRTDINKEFEQVRKEFKNEVKNTELTLKIWIGSIAAASVTVAVAVLSVVIRIS